MYALIRYYTVHEYWNSWVQRLHVANGWIGRIRALRINAWKINVVQQLKGPTPFRQPNWGRHEALLHITIISQLNNSKDLPRALISGLHLPYWAPCARRTERNQVVDCKMNNGLSTYLQCTNRAYPCIKLNCSIVASCSKNRPFTDISPFYTKIRYMYTGVYIVPLHSALCPKTVILGQFKLDLWLAYEAAEQLQVHHVYLHVQGTCR